MLKTPLHMRVCVLSCWTCCLNLRRVSFGFLWTRKKTVSVSVFQSQTIHGTGIVAYIYPCMTHVEPSLDVLPIHVQYTWKWVPFRRRYGLPGTGGGMFSDSKGKGTTHRGPFETNRGVDGKYRMPIGCSTAGSPSISPLFIKQARAGVGQVM